ncbi:MULTISPECIES: antibiotic biosynthesis monooxygenase family protein [unclassified Streptomyces]|uniref:antibiotic biosynthesis monooxygenase family protein n=1 Tax=unclassified Streptomyces TaxID=2593676 RepID=UPI000ABB6A36|nr:antibiotic biosynthesis monooxygenase [Streptomyces polychromogenes]
MVTYVNKLNVHGDLVRFIDAEDRLTRFVSSRPGCVSHQTLRLVGTANFFVELSVWEDTAAHRAAVTSEGFRELAREIAVLATREQGLYETLPEQAPATAA